MKLGIFVPAYNEESTIQQVLLSLPKSFPGISQISIFVIDDGSTDDTIRIAKSMGAQTVSIKPNNGLANAYKIGLQTCLDDGADLICHLDADGQYHGSEISLLLEPIIKGEADFVTGDRQVEKLTFLGPARKYGNMVGSLLLRLITGMQVKDASSGFRAYSRNTAQKLEVHSSHTYTHETLIEAYYLGLKVKEVPITFGKRGASSSVGGHQNVSRLTRNLLKHIYCSFRDILKAKRFYSRKHSKKRY